MRVHRFGWLVAALAVCAPVQAFEGRYWVRGTGPEGAYEGSAEVRAPSADGGWTIALRTFQGRSERRAKAPGYLEGPRLRFRARAVRDGLGEEAPLWVCAEPLRGEVDRLAVVYRDGRGSAVRREVWQRDPRARIPVVVVALAGGAGFPGVSPEQAREAQAWILAQLEVVYAPQGLSFFAVDAPALLPGEPFDADRDDRLGPVEVRALRDALELDGRKRPGRVVLTVTAADFVAHDCRGWTLGEAPSSPDTLEDPNDNFSLLGLRYLDPSRFHTVAHEVGHQLGLDDIGPLNRHHLEAPERDQLMESGGAGLFLDPALARLLRRAAARFPNHGLDGRRPELGDPSLLRPALLETLSPSGPERPAGLPAPPPPARSLR